VLKAASETPLNSRALRKPNIEGKQLKGDTLMSGLNIRPLYDRIVVRRVDPKEQMRGGIIIPDTAKEKPQEAEVIAVGEGKYSEDGKRMKLDVKKGDKVLIGKYSGTEIKLQDQEFTIIREDEVLGIVE
jgi:chaperonin GroES